MSTQGKKYSDRTRPEYRSPLAVRPTNNFAKMEDIPEGDKYGERIAKIESILNSLPCHREGLKAYIDRPDRVALDYKNDDIDIFDALALVELC